MSSLIEWINSKFELQSAAGAVGTKVAEYIESKTRRECRTCEHANDSGDRCNEVHMLQDKEVKTDPKTGTKIVEPILGCCRYWEPKKL